MTDTARRALSERIATLAEAAGLPSALVWEAAEYCPQGHDNEGGSIGEICYVCITDWDIVPDSYWSASRLYRAYEWMPPWHPEWRIGRVAKDLTDPANLLTVVEAWRQQRPLRSWRMTSRLDAEIKCNAYAGVSEVPNGFIKVETLRNGSTPWEALGVTEGGAPS